MEDRISLSLPLHTSVQLHVRKSVGVIVVDRSRGSVVSLGAAADTHHKEGGVAGRNRVRCLLSLSLVVAILDVEVCSNRGGGGSRPASEQRTVERTDHGSTRFHYVAVGPRRAVC